MSEKPISPLRQRMIEDMMVRNFVEKTRNDYIRQVKTFTAFLGRSPDQAISEDLRRFQLHQTRAGVRPPSINGSVAALRFFFTVTLDRPEMARHLTFVREPRKIPAVLSPEEVARLLEAAPGPKYKAALSAAYAAGRTSILSACCCGSSRARAARIALRCSRQSCWSCYATGIASPGRRSGYSPDVIRCCR
jgi:site-specific recombinase XerD